VNPEEERFKIKLFAGAERWRPAEAEGSTFADLIALGQAAAAITGAIAAAASSPCRSAVVPAAVQV